MTAELVKGVATALFTAIDTEDWDSLAKLLHPETIYEVSGFPRMMGKKAVLDYYENQRPIVYGNHIVEKIVLNENGGVFMGLFEGEKKDGSKIKLLFADDMELEDFRITKRRVYFCQPEN